MTFLSTPDLITCTLINTDFEIEARKRLLAQKWVRFPAKKLPLSPQSETTPYNITHFAGYNPRNLLIQNFKFSCPSILTNFLSSHAHHVVNLKILLPLRDPKWRQYLEYLSTFLPNLVSLQIQVITLGGLNCPDFIPPSHKPRVFWKVRKLGLTSSTWAQSGKLVDILPLFPNLASLSSDGIDPAVLEKFLHRGPSTQVGPRVTMTRLELSDPSFDLGHFSVILNIVAGTLESVKFFGMDNCPPHWLMNETGVAFPTMPRLKVFAVRLSPNSFRMITSGCSVVMPRLRLRFGRQAGKIIHTCLHSFI